MKDIILYTLVVTFMIILVTGITWCKWAGYKDRYSNGGCIGFVTSCDSR